MSYYLVVFVLVIAGFAWAAVSVWAALAIVLGVAVIAFLLRDPKRPNR